MSPRRIWLIGASNGIGRAMALQLAAQGDALILSARDAESLKELAHHCPGSRILPLDLSNRAALNHAIAEMEAEPVDVLINTAALYEPSAVENIADDVLDEIIAVNLTAMFHLAKAAPRVLRAGGQLILFGSVAGYIGLPKGQPYSATKAAVANLAETLRIELAPRVDVRLVSPGFVRTRLTEKNSFAMPAIINPEDAARAVLKGMQGRSFEIHFPRRFTLLMKLLRVLPYSLALALTQRLSGKR